jgi:carbonic anhydrase/acetyltransferase-like protein (isoleucine patch superfamily)
VAVGDVTLGDYASVWFNAVLRADINRIVVGHHSNVQDTCVFHLSDEHPTLIGNYVTVGHGAIVHAATVQDETLIGMGSVILDGVLVGEGSIVGAKALVREGMKIPPGSLVMGVPARIVRPVTPQERALNRAIAEKYVNLAAHYLARGLGK